MRFFLPALAASCCCASLFVQAGEPARPYNSTIVVTGSRLGAEIRPAEVITRAELDALPVTDTASALRMLAGVDLRERVPFGGQADLGLYGSGFEEALVLVDGLCVNDPQTGHHSLEMLPPLEAIDRIEVLQGPSSVIYGPGALAGVVQIFTRRPPNAADVEAGAAAGGHRLARGAFYAGSGGLSTSGSLLNTAGYAPDTELHQSNGFARYSAGGFDAEVLAGDKRLGEWQGYSDVFPNEWEAVAGVAGQAKWSGGPWQASAGFRQKHDRFILDRARPQWYEASHVAGRWSAQATRRFSAAGGAFILGLDASRETIDSNQLGNHGRNYGGLFGEGFWTLGKVQIDAGLRCDALGRRRSASPQMSVQWPAGGGWKAFVSAGRSERLPSFTELYTRSPAWLGTPDLAPERVWGFDCGVKRTAGASTAALSLFYRRGGDLIDMVRLSGTAAPFEARNVQTQETAGLSAQARGSWNAKLGWQLSCVVISQSAAWPSGIESRYAEDHLKHKEVAGLTLDSGETRWGLFATASQRQDSRASGEMDASLAWSPKALNGISVYLEGRNLLNHSAPGFFGFPGPGRWIWAGVSFRRGGR